MIFKQYRYEPLNQASYFLACWRKHVGFVVDPVMDLGVGFYEEEARQFDISLVGVLETHVHADFVSCAADLARARRCSHYLHEATRGSLDFEPLSHGQILELGNVRIRVLHTPGHTPEHVSYLITDVTRADEPWAVLTGDSLLVGDVGRPDLLVGDQAQEDPDVDGRAILQYRSIRDRLLSLPDHVEVYPGHYGRSACGGINMSSKASSTIYFEKKFNLPMRQPNGEIFAEFVRDTSKPLPDSYEKVKMRNLGLSQERGGGLA